MRVAALVGLFAAAVALIAGVSLLVASNDGQTSSPVRAVATPWAEASSPAAAPGHRAVKYARPVRLVIPKIGVDAVVERVGLTADHAMASPSGPATVGWYRLGPQPGNEGSAVIDGHSGYAGNVEAVFDHLGKVGKGDKIYIEDARGRRATFIVRGTKVYARTASADEVFAATKSRRLNLVTCTGTYDVAAGTHSERLVVFAQLQPSGERSDQ